MLSYKHQYTGMFDKHQYTSVFDKHQYTDWYV
jgi:hypothetical protein